MAAAGVSTTVAARNLAPPDTSAPDSSERSGGALRAEVARALQTLRRLLEDETLDAVTLEGVRGKLERIERRLGREELEVVIVGERQSGKSTLLDAIVGDRLLGGARGQIEAVTYLRRRDTPDFRASFASGETEVFSRRVPDPGAALDERAQALELRRAQCDEQRATALAARDEAQRNHEQAARELAQAEAAQARARESAGADAARLASSRDELGRAEAQSAALERAIPASVRRTPGRWALWLWCWRAIFLLLRRSLWQQYRALRAVTEAARSASSLARAQAALSGERSLQAEAELEKCRAALARAGSELARSEGGLAEREAQSACLQGELEELRSRREHGQSERFRQFLAELKALSGARGRERGLSELAIDYPARLLPEDVTIVDIPGMVAVDAPSWQLVREQADGCILVSELDRGISEPTKRFLRALREVVPHLLLVLTKADEAYAEAQRRGKGEPWEQVELARRVGTRRFARELGRDPDSVLSVCVAAEAALARHASEFARRFEGEIAKLFQLLRRERALIVGAHTGGALRRCIEELSAPQLQAEEASLARMQTLEGRRTPAPAVFKAEQQATLSAAADAAADEAVRAARGELGSAFASERQRVLGPVVAARSGRELGRALERVSRELPAAVAELRARAVAVLEARAAEATSALYGDLHAKLCARFGLVGAPGCEPEAPTGLVPGAPPGSSARAIRAEARRALAAFDGRRWALAVAVALVGTVLAVALRSWPAALCGAVLAASPLLLLRPDAIRLRELQALGRLLDDEEARCHEALAAARTSAAAAVRDGANQLLDEALARDAAAIDARLAAEQRAIDGERRKLAERQRLRAELAAHDAELGRLLQAARDASIGLCR